MYYKNNGLWKTGDIGHIAKFQGIPTLTLKKKEDAYMALFCQHSIVPHPFLAVDLKYC